MRLSYRAGAASPLIVEHRRGFAAYRLASARQLGDGAQANRPLALHQSRKPLNIK
jgi:hypothetical protein